jgi:NADPH-dependent 2,4-dienoyl-CoA reductase/sulfur reductase-like enzyme/nitrite reductase/ring-hydroxylating ferredoxin subunit
VYPDSTVVWRIIRPQSSHEAYNKRPMAEPRVPHGPDLSLGTPIAGSTDGVMISGHVGDDEVVLARSGNEFFAVGARCTHYRGRLARGLIVGDTVRCPLHHACFSLRTGEALRAPAFDPISRWRVEVVGDMAFVREKLTAAPGAAPPSASPDSILIIGGGAAGSAAADMIRREGYEGPVTIVSADSDLPVDRPNLSKDYLAGDAQDDWLPIWSSEQYAERNIELVLGRRAMSLDPNTRKVGLDDGSTRSYGALLIAIGAEPLHLPIPGASQVPVFYLRTWADGRAIVAKLAGAKRALVIGASFIGLEVSASLRKRGLEVDVVAPEKLPLERVMGADIGRFVQAIHESNGVRFHLGQTVASGNGRSITLSGGDTLDADFIVVGAGVRPALALAEASGLAIDKGIVVNEYLQTTAPNVFAAGDNVRWPDPHTGKNIRVEHWVVAQRQGQTAARNMLGRHERFDAVPFFWSRHFDISISYVGHADQWDNVAIDGSLAEKNCRVTYSSGGNTLAVATVGRQRESLVAETELERTHVNPKT